MPVSLILCGVQGCSQSLEMQDLGAQVGDVLAERACRVGDSRFLGRKAVNETVTVGTDRIECAREREDHATV